MFNQIKILWHSRELIRYFVFADLRIIYKNKIIGVFWTLLDPLLMMLAYMLIVVVIFDHRQKQYPVLLFSGLLGWKWFSYSLVGSVTSITRRSKLIQTVYFAKIVLPVCRIIVGFINYIFGFIVLIPLLLLYEVDISIHLIWLPFIILVQFMLTIGTSLVCSTIGVYFYDLANIIQFAIRILFYLSPILYSIQQVPKHLTGIYMLNPFAALFASYKNIIVRGIPPNNYMIFTTIISLIILCLGLIIFNQKEHEFAKNL